MYIPQLSFPHGFDEKIASEAEQKGYWGQVTVRLPSGRQYSVCFYDPVTLSQNLKSRRQPNSYSNKRILITL